MSLFRPAVVANSWLRLAFAGPSKTGKSMSALETADELVKLLSAKGALQGNGKIAGIDTEHGSLSKYARYYKFDTVNLKDFHPEQYIKLMNAAEKEGYSFLIIDSGSHEWSGKGGVLELHAKQVPLTPKNNSFAAWAKITPLHNAFIERLLSLDMHVICTMRAREKLVQTNDGIKSVGTRAVQRKDMQFEFDAMGMLTYDHKIKFGGTRCLALSDREFIGDDLADLQGPGKKIAAALAEWLTEGIEEDGVSEYGGLPQETINTLEEIRTKAGITDKDYQTILIQNGVTEPRYLTESVANTLIRKWQGRAIREGKISTIDNTIAPKTELSQTKPQPAVAPPYDPEKESITREQIDEIKALMLEIEPDQRERSTWMIDILQKRHVSRLVDLNVIQANEIIHKLKEIAAESTVADQIGASLDAAASKTEETQPEPEPTPEPDPENLKMSAVPRPPKAQKKQNPPKRGGNNKKR